MYSMRTRAAAITTRPLNNIMQPMHSLSRFQWVGQPPYISPSWYPGGPANLQGPGTTTKGGKGRQSSRYRAPQRGL